MGKRTEKKETEARNGGACTSGCTLCTPQPSSVRSSACRLFERTTGPCGCAFLCSTEKDGAGKKKKKDQGARTERDAKRDAPRLETPSAKSPLCLPSLRSPWIPSDPAPSAHLASAPLRHPCAICLTRAPSKTFFEVQDRMKASKPAPSRAHRRSRRKNARAPRDRPPRDETSPVESSGVRRERGERTGTVEDAGRRSERASRGCAILRRTERADRAPRPDARATRRPAPPRTLSHPPLLSSPPASPPARARPSRDGWRGHAPARERLPRPLGRPLGRR